VLLSEHSNWKISKISKLLKEVFIVPNSKIVTILTLDEKCHLKWAYAKIEASLTVDAKFMESKIFLLSPS